MFSRAERFPPMKDPGIPGPASYDPHSPASHWKRGAMLEQEERFKEERKGNGAGGCNCSYHMQCPLHR